MKFNYDLETYKKNREIFETQYKNCDSKDILKFCEFASYKPIKELNKNIRNFELFLFIYSYDRQPDFHKNITLINKDKIYYSYNGKSGTKIHIDFKHCSLIDLWPDQFEEIIKSYKNIKK